MKKKFLRLSAVFCASSVIFAANADESIKSKKNIQNVVYMSVEVGMYYGVFAKNTAGLDIEMSTKNAYGFEGEPSTQADYAEMKRVDAKLKKNIANLVSFEGLMCSYDFSKIEKKFDKILHNSRGVIEVSYDITCDENMRNHEVKANFSAFKNVEFIRMNLEGAHELKFTKTGNQATELLR